MRIYNKQEAMAMLVLILMCTAGIILTISEWL